nr:unnamed protein product [Gossypium raimondii]
MDPNRAVVDDVESIVPVPVQGTEPVDSRPTSSNQEGEAKQAFYQMMNDLFTQYIWTNPAAQQPPPPINPSSVPVIPQIKEFIVLVERACKAEELGKEKRKADYKAQDSWFPKHDRDRTSMSSRATSVASVGNVRQNRSECKHCGKWHLGDCRLHDRSCFKCRSKDHFIRECPMVAEQNTVQSTRPSNVSVRGRSLRYLGNVSGSQRGTKDTAVRSETRAPARAYAIHAREEASSSDVITGTLTLYDNNVIALIDLGSTHSYVCETLVFSKTLPIESTEFVIRVSNPLGRCVMVDKLCKNCPLIIRDLCFPADLMLLPFDEFDIILVVSSMLAQKYVRKGCETYLAYVLDSKVTEKKIESLPVVCEYSDVFPEELSGLPHIRE